jgi:Putative regulator of cell autolysis
MKGLRALRSLTIYPKLVMSFLLVIVPIYILSFQMNYSGQSLVEKQLTTGLQAQVHFYLSSIDTEISRLITLKAEYANDNDFQRLATSANLMNDFERVQAILSAKNKLYLLKSSTPLVEDVKVYIPLLDRSIIANNLNDRIPNEEMKAITDPNNMKSVIFNFQDRLLISQLYPGVVRPGKLPIIALEIELSSTQMRSMLSGIVKTTGGTAILINANQDWHVSSGEIGTFQPELAKLINEAKEDKNPGGSGKVHIKGQSYFVMYEYSPVVDSYLVLYVPMKEMLSPLTRYRDWLWLFSIVSLVVVALFSLSIFRVIHRPLRLLVGAFRKVEKGDLGIKVEHRNFDEFHYLYSQFNHMVGRIQVLIREVYEQQILSQRSELKQLQAQISPHFLYNSFFIVKGLVRRGEEELSLRMLDNLGEYFRFITRSGSEEVTLDAELSHALSYLEIQNMRFAGAIDATYDPLPEEWKAVHVPRLILQPLLENAYKHGLEEKVSGGLLYIRFKQVSGGLSVTVEDNGDRLGDEQLSLLMQNLQRSHPAQETTGILNVSRRLRLTFGEAHDLNISRSRLGGLRVEFVIPEGYMLVKDR